MLQTRSVVWRTAGRVPIRGHVRSLRSKNSRLENFEGEMMSKNTFLLQVLMAAVAASTLMSPTETAARAVPEYSAAEAKKHIGETATVVGKVDCIEHGRRHTDLEMGACLPNTLLMVVVPDELAGLKLELGQLRGASIAVTGKIESAGGMPQIIIKSAAQIVPRTPVGPDYLSTAMEKQSRGDL